MKHLYSNTFDLLGKSNTKVQFNKGTNTIDFFLFDNYENIKSKKEIDYKYFNYNNFFLFI